MNCDRCNGELIIVETPELKHWAKEVCSSCNKWFRWLKNPDAPQTRSKTTKCAVKYDMCKLCGRNKEKLGICETLEAHHIIPLSEGGEDIPENILVLCTACHRMAHWLRLYTHTHLLGTFKS